MNYFLTDKVFPIAVLISAMVLVPFRSAHAQATGNAKNGKKVFEKLGCFRCHGSAGEGMPQKEKEASPPQIAGTHLALKDFVKYVRAPKGRMPPFSPAQASDAELSDVYAFLQSVSSQPGLQHKVELSSSANAQNGQQLFTAYGCYECHGYQGQGSAQTGGSRLGPPQIPLSGYVAYVRQPTGQMPPYTSKAISDAQLADIYAFLQSRPKAASAKSIPLLN